MKSETPRVETNAIYRHKKSDRRYYVMCTGLIKNGNEETFAVFYRSYQPLSTEAAFYYARPFYEFLERFEYVTTL